MTGMYEIRIYERFSLTDVCKFERRLRKWCNEECMHGKSMLIFDNSSLKIGGSPDFIWDGTEAYNKVVLPNISLAYTCLAGTDMCVMYKIWENKTRSVIYTRPLKWNGSELWLGE